MAAIWNINSRKIEPKTVLHSSKIKENNKKMLIKIHTELYSFLKLLIFFTVSNMTASFPFPIKSEPVYLPNAIFFNHKPLSLGVCHLKTKMMSTIKQDLLTDYELNMNAFHNKTRNERLLSECSKKCCDPNSSTFFLNFFKTIKYQLS